VFVDGVLAPKFFSVSTFAVVRSKGGDFYLLISQLKLKTRTLAEMSLCYFDLLPNEVLEPILLLTEEYRGIARMVCNRFYCLTKTRKILIQVLVSSFSLFVFGANSLIKEQESEGELDLKREFVLTVAGQGTVQMLDFLERRYQNITSLYSGEPAVRAAFYNNLDNLKWIRSRHQYGGGDALASAVLGGSVECVNFLFDNISDIHLRDNSYLLDIAAENGHIQMAILLRFRGLRVRDASNLTLKAAENGHLEFVKFMIEREEEYEKVKRRHKTTPVKRQRELHQIAVCASYEGHTNILDWVEEQVVISYTNLKLNNISTLEWIYKRDPSITQFVMNFNPTDPSIQAWLESLGFKVDNDFYDVEDY
jgi:hypothetical protein